MRLASLLLGLTLLAWPSAVWAAGEEPAAPAFDGEPIIREVTSTAYTSGPESTGKRPGHPQYGLTFTGARAQEGRTIAVDPREIPLGSLVHIEGFDRPFVAEDTGDAIKGERIDLYMEDLDDALQWGVRKVRIVVVPKI